VGAILYEGSSLTITIQQLETARCNIREGKSMDEYAEVMKLFNEQLDRLGAKNSEAISFVLTIKTGRQLWSRNPRPRRSPKRP
jgi:hypothetical protein